MKVNISNIRQTGYKILSSFIATTSVITMFGNAVTPIYAEDTDDTEMTATISGNTLGNNTNSIRSGTSTCEGEQQLSGTDAEVFKKLTPESDGDIICAKSDGFRTEVSGTNDVKNYHWTAWYKKNKDDDPDKSNDLGNYRGFNKSKVEQWQNHRTEIEGLNGGAFPEVKDYTYPTDTKENKLDFWGDIAGYYNVLGDPQYKSIHMTAYQQFSYKTKHVVQRTEIVPDTSTSDDGSGTGTPSIGNGYSGSGGSSGGKQNTVCPSGYIKNKKGKCVPKTNPPACKTVYKTVTVGGRKYKTAFTDCGDKANIWFGGSVLGYSTDEINTETSTIGSNEMLGKVIKTEKSNDNLVDIKEEDGVTMNVYEDITYSWETQEVKVAEADLGSGTYATEFAAMPKLSLKAGSSETSTISTNNSGFWQVTPRYWTDGGKINLKNDSTLPYHFESEETAGVGVNTVNVYSNLKQTDKLYTLIHGYPNIVDVPNIPGVTGNPTYPNDQDETCVEVDDDAVCSKKQTPVIVTEISLDDDNPQELEEVDKSVHLVKNQETQAELKSKNK